MKTMDQFKAEQTVIMQKQIDAHAEKLMSTHNLTLGKLTNLKG